MEMGGQEERLAAGRPPDLGLTRAEIWTLPNALTLLRILLVAPFILLYEAGATTAAAAVFAVAALSDGLDGFLARRLHQESRLGALLDPVGDKLLCLAALIVLVLSGRLPSWLLLASLTRDGVVLAIALVALLLRRATPSEPMKMGKLATLAINLTVILALALAIWPVEPLERTLQAFSVLSAISLGLAAIGYAFRALSMSAPGARDLPERGAQRGP